MMIVVLLILFIGLALAAIFGLGTDSRDPQFSLWRSPDERQPEARRFPRRPLNIG